MLNELDELRPFVDIENLLISQRKKLMLAIRDTVRNEVRVDYILRRNYSYINSDYERNRFTQLGDWPTFSVNKDAREKEILSDAKEALALAKRKRRKLPDPLLPIGDPNGEGRALLLVPVE